MVDTNPAENESTPAQAEQVQTATKTEPQVNQASKPDRTFTRDEVTRIVKARQDRFSNGLCKKYGVGSIKELDDLYNKHKDYDDIVTERDGLKKSHSEMSEKLAFLSNGIDPAREDDVRTYFKGKGLQFDEAILKEHLQSHPEWVKANAPVKPTTTVQKIGVQKSAPKPETELQMAEKLYGMKLS